jgi:SAM-dependent methyltransferase
MTNEGFKPIAVTSPADAPLAFGLRCVVDLQLATIARYLRPALKGLTGAVLDVGAGQSPWRGWLPNTATYQGIDIGYAADFGMQPKVKDVIYYAGADMPLADNTYDAVLCIEVLEHAQDPRLLLLEVIRVMKGGATLFLTVPWSARRHHIPHDYRRFTREGLALLLDETGFDLIEILERGNDVAVIANKLTVLSLRLGMPKKWWHSVATWPLALFCGALASVFIACAHVCIALSWGSKEDPLGYFVRAQKAVSPT